LKRGGSGDTVDKAPKYRARTALTVVAHVVDFGSIVDAAVATMRGTAEASGIKVEVGLDRGLPPIVGDPVGLQQVVWNLLSNAIKFTGSGGRVDVRARSLGDSIELTVRDTGSGIPRELLPHVFERFRQGEPTGSHAGRGLGLGLTIVRYLVERHGGTVEAASPGQNQGAVFTMRLPVAGASPSESASS
jgi:two-component system CheB/CheR fusion protein